MDCESHDHRTAYDEQVRLLKRSLNIWLIIVYAGAASIVALTILGFAFHIMLFGLAIGLLILSPTYDPAYRLLVRLLKLKGLPKHLAKPPKLHVVYSLVLLIAPLVMVIFGLVILGYAGLCNQNLICLVLKHTPR